MKKLLFVVVMLSLIASQSFGQAYNPVPLVIDVQDVVEYAFDGTDIDIPFSLSGKPAMIYLVIQSKLADDEKPVAIRNGFRGWHFVNGIDTTMYVSSARTYTTGADLAFPWTGHGNEREYENYQDSGAIGAGTYTYYLFGYDNVSDREIANDHIQIGQFSYPSTNKFYPYDETGALRAQPLLMGTLRYAREGKFSEIPSTWHKFYLGDDPYDESLIVTSSVFGYASGQIDPDHRFIFGVGIPNPRDYDIFYFPRVKRWEAATTIVKYTFVPGGEAIQDAAWGDYENVEWWTFPNAGFTVSVVEGDDDYLYFNDYGQNPVQFPTDLVRGFTYEDPTDVLFDVFLDEFWQPNNPGDTNAIRMSGMAGGLDRGPEKGQFYMSGDATCLVDLVDCHKMLDGADEPFASDGSGYVVWLNSNGDFFGDRNPFPEVDNPEQLWACNSYEPRKFNNMRQSATPADMNGFEVAHLDFGALYGCISYTPDGSAIDYLQFADNTFSSGETNAQKVGFGYSLDVGGQFDGIYMDKPMLVTPGYSDIMFDGTCRIGWDSDGGIISSEDVAVEDDAPAAFSVAQNTPNPFNPSTTISFSLARDGNVSVDVYNIAGQKVDTLVNDFMTAGSQSVVWDASGQAAGVYFYTVTSGDFTRTTKMTLLK